MGKLLTIVSAVLITLMLLAIAGLTQRTEKLQKNLARLARKKSVLTKSSKLCTMLDKPTEHQWFRRREGIIPLPSKFSKDNYTPSKQWTRVGIVKSQDQSNDTMYPLYERSPVAGYDIYEYQINLNTNNEFWIRIDSNGFLEDGDTVTIPGMESQTWICKRDGSIRWATY